MTPLDLLEVARGGPFIYRHRGQVRGLFSPLELGPGGIMSVLEDGFPFAMVADMPLWKSDLLLERWRAHYDLPPFRDAQRLLYLLDRYSAEIEFDLRQAVREDLGDLFRARRWRYLLNLVDRLPGHSYYSEAVANDEEHARLIAQAEAEREESKKKSHPPLRTWTPEMAALTAIIDALNVQTYVMKALKAERGKAGSPPEALPRPETAIDRARKEATWEKRVERHQSLADRLLPHKRSK